MGISFNNFILAPSLYCTYTSSKLMIFPFCSVAKSDLTLQNLDHSCTKKSYFCNEYTVQYSASGCSCNGDGSLHPILASQNPPTEYIQRCKSTWGEFSGSENVFHPARYILSHFKISFCLSATRIQFLHWIWSPNSFHTTVAQDN